MVSLDNLASRYGLLPSEALARGTTFDFRIMEVSAKYEKFQRDKSEAEADGKVVPSKMPTEKEMQAMLLSTKEDTNANS